MPKYVTRKTIRKYQEVMQQVNKDLGRTVYLYTKTGHNPLIPWDSGADSPISPQDWPDENDWWAYSEQRIDNVNIIWGEEKMNYFVGGSFDPDECDLTVRLTDVLVNESEPNGDTYFDLMDYCIVDGIRCIKKSVITRMGLKDLYMCMVTVTRKLE